MHVKFSKQQLAAIKVYLKERLFPDSARNDRLLHGKMASLVKTSQESPAEIHVFRQSAVDFGQPVACRIYPESASHSLEQGGFMRGWLKRRIGTKIDDNPFVTWPLCLIVKNKSVRDGRHQRVDPVRLFFLFPCLALLELRVRGQFSQSVGAFPALIW